MSSQLSFGLVLAGPLDTIHLCLNSHSRDKSAAVEGGTASTVLIWGRLPVPCRIVVIRVYRLRRIRSNAEDDCRLLRRFAPGLPNTEEVCTGFTFFGVDVSCPEPSASALPDSKARSRHTLDGGAAAGRGKCRGRAP